MWLVASTLPVQGLPLLHATCQLAGDSISCGKHAFSLQPGTSALLAAMCVASSVLGEEPPKALLAGDIGLGDGSREVYAELSKTMPDAKMNGITFHYLFADAYWHDHLLWIAEGLANRPMLVASAGYMYAAKMCGACMFYELFTPDISELAFLADPEARHPLHVKSAFAGSSDNNIEALAEEAHSSGNSSDCMVVSGRKDIIMQDGGLVCSVEPTLLPGMPFVAGAGDCMTGLASALLDAGCTSSNAGHLAALAIRHLGVLAKPTPATTVSELLFFLPEALEKALDMVPMQSRF